METNTLHLLQRKQNWITLSNDCIQTSCNRLNIVSHRCLYICRQFDLRTPEAACSGNPQNVLINLNAHMGHQAEAKCLAINPLRSEQLAVGANDPFVRLYDRRMLSCKSIRFPSDAASRFVEFIIPSDSYSK